MASPNKKLIGLLGGSFDPPHKGHLKISKISIKKLKLNKIYWLITKKNPLKKKSFFNLNERIKKCKEITKNNKNIHVKFTEKFTSSNKIIDNLRYLIKKNKDSTFFLIIGSDNLIDFHKWKSSKKILKLCKIIVFSRKGFEKKAQKLHFTRYSKNKNVMYIKNYKIDISSSKIRKSYLR